MPDRKREGDGSGDSAMDRGDPAGTAADDLVEGLRTWAGLSTERRPDGSLALRLGPREVGRVHDDGVVDVTLPGPTREHLVETDRTTPVHLDRAAGRASYYLPDHPAAGDGDVAPASVEDALRLLRVAYLGHALSLSHTGPGGEVLASIDVDPELRDLDVGDGTSTALDDLRER